MRPGVRQSFGRTQTVEEAFEQVQTLSRTLPQDKADTSIHQANQEDLLGLAFSGGGIRGATFNLGVLQALAKRRLLSRFDYLSTISGGCAAQKFISNSARRRKRTLLARFRPSVKTAF